jgi:D-alanine-D-alanine ligase|tara:strand:- start:328 stop:1257 length:930 start_codon:yes stop_codon:yes gene_type:complete
MSKKKIMVIYGGISAEREISIISSKEIIKSLRSLNYEVIDIDADPSLLKEINYHKPNVIFNALHGTWGEDGEVQKILEASKVPYTHSGIESSQLAMDKFKSGKIFKRHNFSHPRSLLCSLKDLIGSNPMNYPYVIKPNNNGSSVGVVMINSELEKNDYIKKSISGRTCSEESDKLLIQEFIDGPEIQVAIYGNGKSDSIEIVPKNKFYDYESKYFDNGATQHIIPPRLDNKKIDEVNELGLKAHKILKCRGISRSDFILDKETGNFVILEINTQPGMTPTSLVPEIAKYHGISFDSLIDWIIKDASINR